MPNKPKKSFLFNSGKTVSLIALLVAILCKTPLFAEVVLETKNHNAKLELQWINNATQPVCLGGVRLFADKAVTGFPDSQWTTRTKSVEGKVETTILYHDSLLSAKSVGPQGEILSLLTSSYPDGESLPVVSDYEILLKNGGLGTVGDPMQEPSIDTGDIDSIIANPNFYNPDYRYIDTLGARGGEYSGGISDTWLGETQVILHFPEENYSIHGGDSVHFSLDATKGDPLYWMSVVMGQEYFSVDMQWMLAKAVQETGAGSSINYMGTNAEGAYGPWEIEQWTGKHREKAYPALFQNGTITSFWDDDVTPINSANVVNGYMYSIAATRYIYSLLNYFTDARWDKILKDSKSHFFPLSLLLVGYNNGAADLQYTFKPFWHVDYCDQYMLDTFAHDTVESVVKKGYVTGIINGVKSLEDGSKAAFVDKSLELVDIALTIQDVNRFFYGDGGHFLSQGDGGLLAHYNIDRNSFDLLIETAFKKLKGKAPSTTNTEAISLRYDFLTLLRVVKDQLAISWTRPSNVDEWNFAVYYNSKKDDSLGVEADSEYPYGKTVGIPDITDGFSIDIHGTDNKEIKEICWTLDPRWRSWNKGVYKEGTLGDQIFTLSVPKSMIKDKTDSLWYMVTDMSGNSVVKSLLIEMSIDPDVVLESASAIDTDGDGNCDSIRVTIESRNLEGGDVPNAPSLFRYSWPTNSELEEVVNFEYASEVFCFMPANPSGLGSGLVELQYPSMDSVQQCNIVDKVGPVILSAQFPMEDSFRDKDTLKLGLSEELDPETLKDLNQNYFFFSSDSNGTKISEMVEKILVVSNDSIIAILAKGAIEYKELKWMRFASDSSVTDLVGNTPHEHSMWIPITKGKTSIWHFPNKQTLSSQWELQLYPNPYCLDSLDQYGHSFAEMGLESSATMNEGIAVMLRSKGLSNALSNTKLTLSVFDNIGNTVATVDDSQFEVMQDKNIKVTFVSLKNSLSQLAASGTYLALLKLKDCKTGEVGFAKFHLAIKK